MGMEVQGKYAKERMGCEVRAFRSLTLKGVVGGGEKGGKREGSGRKKIGQIINIRIDEKLLNEIDKTIKGKSRAEKIRNCLRKGLCMNNGDN